VPLLDQVIDKYPKEVRIVFKNFPLRNHALARPAAVAALAAGEQGRFWEYHDKIFENYSSLDNESFEEFARGLGLDVAAFNAARKKPEFTATINREVKEGGRVGVRGTPTIFINGKRLNQRSLGGFSSMIERELQRLGKATGRN
jgi:protein-disulfide isomerase